MRTIIYYFTGTGNSLKIAKDIAAKLGGTELKPISKAITSEIDLSADRIGLVFPVYVWGPPVIVTEFIKKMKPVQGKYIFAVTTYGGFPGATLPVTAELLASKGMELAAGFAVRMPGNYTPLYGAISEQKQKKFFAAAEQKVDDIAKAVSGGIKSAPEKSFFLTNLIFTRLLYNMGIRHMREADKSYVVLPKCNSCNICYRICPVSNIKMENGKPVWQHKCEQCMACLQFCPVEAIQYGKSTESRKRYRHPEVKANDLFVR